MDTKSAVAIKSDGTERTKQASGSPSSACERQQSRIRMVQNVLLIWLDNNIDDKSDDSQNTVAQLRPVVNSIHTYTDGDQCIQFIETIDNDKVCIIISDSLGQHIVPRVHNISQVDSIFILCDNKQRHEQWTKDWPKIKGEFTDISLICKALKQVTQQCEHNAISINFIDTSGDVSKKNLDQLNCSFMYTQILKQFLLTIEFEQQHFDEFINYCCEQFARNNKTLEKIKQFEQTYRDEMPILLYTRECFLYSMLNRALRLIDMNVIIKMGFFIGDLHRHIEQLHSEQFGALHNGEILTVYRGQGLSAIDFKQMMNTKGGLLSFNSFLSTTKDHAVSHVFAESSLSDPNLVGILFVMTIHPSQSTSPFACIKNVSNFQEEDEVLFSMHTVFRIQDIKPLDENNRLFQVDLTLTSDNDKDLCVLTERMREELLPDEEGWYRLCKLLLRMGHPQIAQEICESLLDKTADDRKKGLIYYLIGWAKRDQGEYQEAIKFCQKSIEIRQQSLPPNHSDLASAYNNIGMVYDRVSEYSKALSSYEEALKIRQQSLPLNHCDLAISYSNIGVVYETMGEYSNALSYYEKALAIRQQALPPNHPDLASSYNNIGLVYSKMGEYSKALPSHEKAVEIRQQSLPLNHPDLASSYNNIGLMYFNMGNHSKALSYYEKDLEISQKTLPQNHPDFAKSYGNIGLVYSKMGEYLKALSSHEKALQIRQQSLPLNHPDFACSYNNIGLTYEKVGEHSEALSFHEKALEIRQQSLPPNHPELAKSYNNIGWLYEIMRDFSKARSFYEHAVDIGQRTLPVNHPILCQWLMNLERVKDD
jgi:tetratricopeptide (TPR) repeat protein